jgi:hypothetical protein
VQAQAREMQGMLVVRSDRPLAAVPPGRRHPAPERRSAEGVPPGSPDLNDVS